MVEVEESILNNGSPLSATITPIPRRIDAMIIATVGNWI